MRIKNITKEGIKLSTNYLTPPEITEANNRKLLY